MHQQIQMKTVKHTRYSVRVVPIIYVSMGKTIGQLIIFVSEKTGLETLGQNLWNKTT